MVLFSKFYFIISYAFCYGFFNAWCYMHTEIHVCDLEHKTLLNAWRYLILYPLDLSNLLNYYDCFLKLIACHSIESQWLWYLRIKCCEVMKQSWRWGNSCVRGCCRVALFLDRVDLNALAMGNCSLTTSAKQTKQNVWTLRLCILRVASHSFKENLDNSFAIWYRLSSIFTNNWSNMKWTFTKFILRKKLFKIPIQMCS